MLANFLELQLAIKLIQELTNEFDEIELSIP